MLCGGKPADGVVLFSSSVLIRWRYACAETGSGRTSSFGHWEISRERCSHVAFWESCLIWICEVLPSVSPRNEEFSRERE